MNSSEEENKDVLYAKPSKLLSTQDDGDVHHLEDIGTIISIQALRKDAETS